MNAPQRWFLVASFILVAASLALYCTEYRVIDPYSREWPIRVLLESTDETDRETLRARLESDPATRAAIPLISLAQPRPEPRPTNRPLTEDEALKEFSPRPFGGIYARTGLTRSQAMVGGILAPILLLVGAGYLALGVRTKKLRTPITQAEAEIDTATDDQFHGDNDCPETRSGSDQLLNLAERRSRLSDTAVVAMAFLPTLLVIDMSAMILLTQRRYPRWVFAVHCLYALARR